MPQLGCGTLSCHVAAVGGRPSFAAAADLTQQGHNVRLWRRDKAGIASLQAQNSAITLKDYHTVRNRLTQEAEVSATARSTTKSEIPRDSTLATFDDRVFLRGPIGLSKEFEARR